MRFYLALFLILYSIVSSAQIGMGDWRLHVPNKKAIDVAVDGNIVYCAFESGLLVYDDQELDKRIWNNVNGLSDLSITCVYFSNTYKSLYIGYENGNFDILKDNAIYNIPAIKMSNIQGAKKINKIVEHNNHLYLATSFGIVKFDPLKKEIRDTYYPTAGLSSIVDVSFRNDSIFGLSNTRLYRGFINNPALPDASQWITDTRLPVETTNIYTNLEVVDNRLIVLLELSDYGKDSAYFIENSGLDLLTDLPFSLELNSLTVHNGKIAVNGTEGILIYNSDGTLAHSYNSYTFAAPKVNTSVSNGNLTWIADNEHGLVRYYDAYSSKTIPFDGPPKNMFYKMDWQDGKLAVAGGGLSGIGMTFSGSGVYTFEDEKWTLHDRDYMTMWNGKNIWDFLAVAVNPINKDEVAVGTFSEIPLSIIQNQQVSQTFDQNNSPITTSSPGGDWSMISDVIYDEDGNLWVLNSFGDQPLKVFTKNGSWYSFDCGANAKNKFSRKMVIDYNGNKWFALNGAGVYGYKDNASIENPADDDYVQLNTGAQTGALPSNTVNAIAVDFENEIWIGTDNGFAVLYNSENAFSATPGNYNTQRIKIEFESNVEYVLGNTNITDIEVDGGNRKWMATANSGIILLSPDGQEILQHFTTDNSPIISNNIIDLEIDQKSGELFIITDLGLVSYRSDASYEDPEYASVEVFPNPARPEFEGVITIQGIRYDSDVKITDVAGNLVYKTTSNGGTATWDGKTVDGKRVATGVYLIWTAANEGKGKKVGKVLVVN